MEKMGEIVLSSVSDGIIKSLRDAAVREIGLLWKVNDELSELEGTLLTIRAVLVDAEEKQVHSNQIKAWLSRLEDVVYKADDLMDEISTEALQREVMGGSDVVKKVRTFFSTSNQFAFRRKMGHQIEAIKKRLAAIRDDRQFLLEERHNEGTKSGYRAREQTHSSVSEEEVVIGRDEDRMKIVQLLLETGTEETVLVVPIVGSGGLGKTTLAQLAFNDEKVQKNFNLKMWVCVSNSNFDVRSLVAKIIKSANNNATGNEGYESFEMEQLQNVLRQKISGKQYLLVLDDVWNENRQLWLNLRNLLSHGAKGSSIIVTTRSIVVAKIMSKVEPYFLGNLDETQSWSLFKKMALDQIEDPSNSNIVEIGKKIVKRCGGIPLAIRTIGRMLYFKNPETEWSSFHKIEFSKISQDENDILPTLKLSYNHLSSHLKHCFAYCSLFPKDHEINVEDLTKLRMAQGFIKSTDATQPLEDVGREYLVDLYWRSFFQEVKKDMFGNIMNCKMHDIMHDLAIQVAGECATLSSVEEKVNKKTRHVSFGFSLKPSQLIPSLLSETSNRLRTILLPSQLEWRFDGRSGLPKCDVIVSNFKFLRILDLHDTGIKIVSESIWKLKHLRYLDLSNTDIMALPNSITKLQNLQTLKLSTLHGFKELPKDFKNLVNLRHLEFDEWTNLNHMPLGLGQLTNLRTLSKFMISEGTGTCMRGKVGDLKELMPLNNLSGELRITNLKHAKDATSANLKEKQYLQSLTLDWSLPLGDVEVMGTVEYEMILEGFQPHPNLKALSLHGYGGVTLSSWLPSLKQLVRLWLWNCKNCQSLPPLDQFPSLKCLYLSDMPALEYISNEFHSSSTSAPLPSLEQLILMELPNLEGWWRGGTAREDDYLIDENCIFLQFPCLSRLPVHDIEPSYEGFLASQGSTTSSTRLYWLTDLYLRAVDVDDEAMECLISNSLFIELVYELGLDKIEDLQSLPKWLVSLSSLKYMKIRKCPKLKYLSPGIQHLVSLEFLKIEERNERDMSNADMTTWQSLKSLNYLVLENLPQLETLPDGLQHVTTLRNLSIQGCNS
ncbi:hypothetical protein FNV43_RR20682 [Rhamnella rubrinervis]|uniref:Disease resistance protein RGA3 n=1 Tax=Rhamnella rubrinervis TaxID=2594499 RepID=A0A8K0E067_9ROSA|nr:hypothetical protein FNV43_RR20682 [Rhamnella rubrinervis]